MQAVATQLVFQPDQADPGIGLLVEMAERNEIDPWDIDIIEVTNRYLLRLDELGQANLPVTGKMFFYAAVLVRMKAEALARQCDVLPALSRDLAGDGLGEEGAFLELLPDRLRRRRVDILVYPKPQRAHQRPITLKDLIDALTLYERQSTAKRLRTPGVMAAEDFIESTHQDHIGNDIDRIQEVLTRLIGGMTGEVRFDFRDLLVEGLSPVTAFMALMFLASDSVVDFEQEFFYGALVVKRV